MGIEEARARWAMQEETLARIGECLFHLDTRVDVAIPDDLAEAAEAAWRLGDDTTLELSGETPAERVVRHRAGTLALIGLTLMEHGLMGHKSVDVSLDAWFVGHALDAADDHGLVVAAKRGRGDALPRFINVDLDVSSITSLVALHDHLAGIGCVLHFAKNEGSHRLSFELGLDLDSIDGTIAEMIRLIGDFPEDAKRGWRDASDRVFNIGIHAGKGLHQPVVELSAELVSQVAAERGRVTFTHYPHHDAHATFRHHSIR